MSEFFMILGGLASIVGGIIGIIWFIFFAVESSQTTKKVEALMDYMGIDVDLESTPTVIEKDIGEDDED